MNQHSTIRRVTFKHPFRLAGIVEPFEPGSFDLVIDEIPIDVSWDAHRTSCRLMVVGGGTTSAYPVSLADIEIALSADREHDTSTGYS